MLNLWSRGEVHAGSWWVKLRESIYLEDQDVDGIVIPEMILKKSVWRARTGSSWLWIPTHDGLLHKISGISWIVEKLIAFQTLGSKDLVSYSYMWQNAIDASITYAFVKRHEKAKHSAMCPEYRVGILFGATFWISLRENSTHLTT